MFQTRARHVGVLKWDTNMAAAYKAKIATTKTRDSIKELEAHCAMCPKSLQYAAQANIPPDAGFKEEIKAIKQRAEQAYICTLTTFHYRRLQKRDKIE